MNMNSACKLHGNRLDFRTLREKDPNVEIWECFSEWGYGPCVEVLSQMGHKVLMDGDNQNFVAVRTKLSMRKLLVLANKDRKDFENPFEAYESRSLTPYK